MQQDEGCAPERPSKRLRLHQAGVQRLVAVQPVGWPGRRMIPIHIGQAHDCAVGQDSARAASGMHCGIGGSRMVGERSML